MDKLALFGGRPIRTKEFRSKPFVGNGEINLVAELMRTGRFSKFVGSSIEGTRELLKKKSRDLISLDSDFSFLGGEYVRKFEADWNDTIKSDYCISVNSATSGLITALIAMGIGPGSGVITTPFSFTATATSILLANAIPVFCDIDLETFCLSPESLGKCITPDTECIMPVHWCGNAGDFDEIISIAKKHNLKLLEDSAQAPATMYKNQYLGTYGDAGVFSFNEPKNIMVGEGGIIATDDREIAEKCRLIRNHGEVIPTDEDEDDYIKSAIGYNFRLTEILAAIGCIQVEKLSQLHTIRTNNYAYLKDKLVKNFGDFIISQKITHPESYFAYAAAFRWLSKESGIPRDLVAKALRAEGIPVATGIPRLLSDHPIFKKKLNLPNARKLNEEYLGFFQMGWPNATEDMDNIVMAFEKILANKNALGSLEKKARENYGKYCRGHSC